MSDATVRRDSAQNCQRMDNIGNVYSRLGTKRGRRQGNIITGRLYFDQYQIEEVSQHRLVRRIHNTPPEDAATLVQIKSDTEDLSKLSGVLESLSVRQKFLRAGQLARKYGGAAVLMATDDGKPISKPLDPTSATRIKRLQVFHRFELQYEPGSINTDAFSDNFGYPDRWRYYPSTLGFSIGEDENEIRSGSVIHASRLIFFRNTELESSLLTEYGFWGEPELESIWNKLSALDLSEQGGAQILSEFGTDIFSIPNLLEMLEDDEGQEMLATWYNEQGVAKSILRALMLLGGPDDEAWKHSKMSIPLNGWDKVYDRVAQGFAALLGWPMTKLYGQAPGGLSTDDASAARNWDGIISNFQTWKLEPAYKRLINTWFETKEGGRKKRAAGAYKIVFAPYEVPTKKEEAETTAVSAKTVTMLFTTGLMNREESRDSLRGTPGLIFHEDETPKVSSPDIFADLPQNNTPTPIQKFDYTERSVMLALYPPQAWVDVASEYATEDPEDLHLTVLYLGELSDKAWAELPELLEFVKCFGVIEDILLSGPGVFRIPDGLATVLLMTHKRLPAFRNIIEETLAHHGITSPSRFGFTPHVTLDYSQTPQPWMYMAGLRDYPKWNATHLSLVRGNHQRLDLPLS